MLPYEGNRLDVIGSLQQALEPATSSMRVLLFRRDGSVRSRVADYTRFAEESRMILPSGKI
jgi:hypothetical protein